MERRCPPAARHQLAAAGVAAAWRLGAWELLEEHLAAIEEEGGSEGGRQGQGPLAVSCSAAPYCTCRLPALPQMLIPRPLAPAPAQCPAPPAAPRPPPRPPRR
jgi:hypothetical protein